MAPTLRVKLIETPTILLYQQENTSVNTSEEVAKEYIGEWRRYAQKRDGQLVRTREVTCQTILKYSVDKTSQKSAVLFKDTGSWATQWDMYDEYQKIKAKRRTSRQPDPVYLRRTQFAVEYYTGDESRKPEAKRVSFVDVPSGIEVRSLLKGLGWMERLLSSSRNIVLLHAFTSGRRQVKEGRKVSMSSQRANIEELWQFESPSCDGRRVNSVTFCKTSPWLVLGTYGALGFTGRLEGILCGWNVKRIGQPELWLPLPGPPTVVSSCPGAPQLCCVALLDGTLLVYQLDTPTPQLVMDTSVSVDKHSSPVWWVEWRDSQMVSTGSTKKSHESAAGRVSFKKLVSNLKPTSSQSGAEVAYVLVSCSEDGTVKEWTFIKNTILCCTCLLNVRPPMWLSLEIAGGISEVIGGGRRPDEGVRGGLGRGGGKEGPLKGKGLLLPQKVPATSMHFRPGDKTTYLVGTAAGDVLLCRTFERERCGVVYRGHTALVTRVAWRIAGEDVSSIFLSAALDDTVRVWYLDKPSPVCILRLTENMPGGYVDACWCPWYSNLLAAVHGGGLHVWEISLSTHTPVLVYAVPGASCASFSPHTRNIVVGDSEGKLSVFHLEGLEESASVFFKYSTAISKLAKLGGAM